MHKRESVPKNETYKILWDFSIQTNDQILARRLVYVLTKKKNFPSSGFCRFWWATEKNKRKRKILRLCQRTKKQWNVRVKVMPIVVVAHSEQFLKSWKKKLEEFEIRGRIETTQTTAVLRSERILGRVLKTWGDLLSLRIQWKTPSVSWFKNT